MKAHFECPCSANMTIENPVIDGHWDRLSFQETVNSWFLCHAKCEKPEEKSEMKNPDPA